MIHEALTWLGIALCLSQSATFAGLNLAVFSLSRFRLEAEAADGNPDAAEVLAMRRDPNSVLATIAWGNVSVNVLLTILSKLLRRRLRDGSGALSGPQDRVRDL
ncbi:MAG: DUF21 domain-containing protein, partial [Nitrospirota bacterium]